VAPVPAAARLAQIDHASVASRRRRFRPLRSAVVPIAVDGGAQPPPYVLSAGERLSPADARFSICCRSASGAGAASTERAKHRVVSRSRPSLSKTATLLPLQIVEGSPCNPGGGIVPAHQKSRRLVGDGPSEQYISRRLSHWVFVTTRSVRRPACATMLPWPRVAC